jgi:hypothetical protein
MLTKASWMRLFELYQCVELGVEDRQRPPVAGLTVLQKLCTGLLPALL